MPLHFAQSRQLKHAVCDEWMRSLFDFANNRPLDAAYSIAFAISMDPIYSSENAFKATIELFDLLDDFVRDTDALTVNEVLTSHCVTYRDYSEANVLYDSLSEPMRRVYDALRVTNANESDDERADRIYENIDHGDVAQVIRYLKYAVDKRIVSVPANRACSEIALSSDLETMLNKTGSLEASSLSESYDVTKIATLIDVKTFIQMSKVSNERTKLNDNSIALYTAYASCVKRFESTRHVRNAIARSRGVRIEHIILPRGSAWQRGTSQMLWMILHTIAALCCSRSNCYLDRFLVVLRNLSFFVWCGECASHWETYGGRNFFEYVSRLPITLKSSIRIDVTLAIRHNEVSTLYNAVLGEPVNKSTVFRLVQEYRDFVAIGLLRRRSWCDDSASCNSSGLTYARTLISRLDAYALDNDDRFLFELLTLNVSVDKDTQTRDSLYKRTNGPIPIGLY